MKTMGCFDVFIVSRELVKQSRSSLLFKSGTRMQIECIAIDYANCVIAFFSAAVLVLLFLIIPAVRIEQPWNTALANTKINSFSFLFPLSISIFWTTWCDILQIDCMNCKSFHLSSFECWSLQFISTYASIECNNFSLIDSIFMVIYWSAFICSSLTRHNQKLCVSFDFVTFVAVRLIDSTFQIGNSQHASNERLSTHNHFRRSYFVRCNQWDNFVVHTPTQREAHCPNNNLWSNLNRFWEKPQTIRNSFAVAKFYLAMRIRYFQSNYLKFRTVCAHTNCCRQMIDRERERAG